MSIQVLQPKDNRIELVNGDEPQRVLLEIVLKPGESPAVARKMTYEEFLDWADEDTLAEWVDGEVVVTSPASDRHQDLADFLSVMRIYVRRRNLGIVRSASFQMKLENGREPDDLCATREPETFSRELPRWAGGSGYRDHFTRKRGARPWSQVRGICPRRRIRVLANRSGRAVGRLLPTLTRALCNCPEWQSGQI